MKRHVGASPLVRNCLAATRLHKKMCKNCSFCATKWVALPCSKQYTHKATLSRICNSIVELFYRVQHTKQRSRVNAVLLLSLFCKIKSPMPMPHYASAHMHKLAKKGVYNCAYALPRSIKYLSLPIIGTTHAHIINALVFYAFS